MKNYDVLKVVATKLNGLQYGMEDRTIEELDSLCKENGIVICFGQSDDLMELRGAIYDEYGCWDGGTICIDEKGNEGAESNLYFPITAVWCKDNISWQYEFEPKHEVFTIYEDADIYCKGIVFFVEDLSRKRRGMDKGKEIQELADVLVDTAWKSIQQEYAQHKLGLRGVQAELIINAGYRKVPDGAVVLTKEMAKEFAYKVKKYVKALNCVLDEEGHYILEDTLEKIDELVEEYGMGVGE